MFEGIFKLFLTFVNAIEQLPSFGFTPTPEINGMIVLIIIITLFRSTRQIKYIFE